MFRLPAAVVLVSTTSQTAASDKTMGGIIPHDQDCAPNQANTLNAAAMLFAAINVRFV